MTLLKILNYWENNVQGSISLLKVMEENGCRKIIFSSSATIYGNNKQQELMKLIHQGYKSIWRD